MVPVAADQSLASFTSQDERYAGEECLGHWEDHPLADCEP